jgi:heat shock protein HslJ
MPGFGRGIADDLAYVSHLRLRQHSNAGSIASQSHRPPLDLKWMERDAARYRPATMNLTRLLVVAVFVAGCNAGGADALDGRTFLGTSVVEGGEDRPLVADTEIRLTFNEGQLGASAGCNTFGGSFRVENGALIVEGGAMTEMGCDEDRAAQDEWLFAFLGNRPRVALSDNELVLTAGETVITLLDREVAEPDLALVGPTWTVDTIISGDAASSVPAGITATITFAEDGSMNIQTGCNSGAGHYTVEGDRIELSGIQQTLIGCDDARGAVEAAVIAVLGPGTATYAIESDSLTLMMGDHGLVLRGT